MVKKKVGIAGYGIIGKRRRQYIDNNVILSHQIVLKKLQTWRNI